MTHYFFYFLAGIVIDFLFTLNLRYVNQKKAIFASLFAFLSSFITVFVLYDILSRLNAERSLWGILFYALGIGVGTFLAMKFKLKKKGN